MKASWIDIMSHGCSVKSAGYVFRNGRYEIDEIRDLPAISFRQPPRDPGMFTSPPNPLMPGIIWDTKEKRVRAYQTVDGSLTMQELRNFAIIRDPSTPFPAGRAYCLPAYHVIGAIDHANKAADQQVHRVGAPPHLPPDHRDDHGGPQDLGRQLRPQLGQGHRVRHPAWCGVP